MCLFPMSAWRVMNCDTGAYEIVFHYPKGAISYEPISLPCGKCVECLSSYSSEWAVRCVLEASLYKVNCMLTLTYADAPISVCKRHLQLFIKRLRKHIAPTRIRYFGCGEYGKRGFRPHYHIIIFGWQPPDLVRFFFRDEHWVYKSNLIARIWGLGYVTSEEVTFTSALYCAKYLQKLSPLKPEQAPPFTIMSLKPGIGLLAFRPELMQTDKVYLHGKSYPVPRYFRRKYAELDTHSEERRLRGKLLSTTLLDRRKKARLRFGVIRF